MREVVTSQVLADVGHEIGEVLELDRDVRLFQGAVGAVAALRNHSGRRYVLKAYRPGALIRARTEYAALQLIRAMSGVPVPDPIVHGVTGNDPRPFLLMSFLPGHRWADLRHLLDGTDRLVLAADAAHRLRRLHEITGPRFGSLLKPEFDTAWASIQHRSDSLTSDYLDGSGNPDVATRLQRLITTHHRVIATCRSAVLCHNDFIDGNLLISRHGKPEITGVVDLETASWDDPLSDLANTARHLRQHDPAAAIRLIDTYGATTPDDQARIAIYDALHTIHQRNWIAYDKPPGWRQAIEALDQHLQNSDHLS